MSFFLHEKVMLFIQSLSSLSIWFLRKRLNLDHKQKRKMVDVFWLLSGTSSPQRRRYNHLSSTQPHSRQIPIDQFFHLHIQFNLQDHNFQPVISPENTHICCWRRIYLSILKVLKRYSFQIQEHEV